MSHQISRREFLKITGISAAATAVLTGCGTNARFVERRTYLNMPEYTLPGRSTFYASTCGECPAACGIVVRTVEGRALKVEGNPRHPVNQGKTCSRAQTAVQGLYNPDRFQSALMQSSRGSGKFEPADWEEAVSLIAKSLQTDKPEGLAFFLGLTSDHLHDLVSEITEYYQIPAPVRFSGLGMLEQRNTLMKASEKLFGEAVIPHFDIGAADMVFSFGANFTETWLSPVAYSLAYGEMRKGIPGKRGYLVHFEPRMSQTAANADEWIPITPGTEGEVALALGYLVQDLRGLDLSPSYHTVNLEEVSLKSGVSVEDLERLAHLFSNAGSPLAIPGANALGVSNGLAVAIAALGLNGIVNNIGKKGGIFLPPEEALGTETPCISTLEEVTTLIKRMKAGEIHTLFVHNSNPVYSLPPEFGFAEALANVPLVVAFSSFPDETSLQADYIFPDHVPLESWGYQKVKLGSDVKAVSGFQPVVSPLYDTRATADLFLRAVQLAGGGLAGVIPYPDEVSYIQAKVLPLNAQEGFYVAPEDKTFWTYWLQVGGWWQEKLGLRVPLLDPAALAQAEFASNAVSAGNEHEFFLQIYPSQTLTDGSGANRPWLQETPDPMTTGLWDTWVEINTETAHELGLKNDDLVKIISKNGEITAIVYLYPAIRPDVVALPIGQGHTYFGQFSTGIGANLMELLGAVTNEANDLVFGALHVKVDPTGKKKQLARKESIPGVYGEEAG